MAGAGWGELESLDMDSVSTEVAIVGAGPIGLELAIALKKAGIDYLHFDARQIGHTVSWFAPETRFFSSNERIAIAGIPLFMPDQTKCTREQYLAYLRAIVQQFDLRINTFEPVTKISRREGGFELTTSREGGAARYVARRIVLATGGTERPRLLGIPGEDLPHVSHYFSDPHLYFGRKLLIVGGRNSAVEAALRCHHAGATVAMSYRKAQLDAASIKYWLYPEMNGLFKSGCIQAHFNTQLKEIHPDRAVLTGQNGPIELAADFVLLLVGYEADMTLCRMAGIELVGPSQTPRFDPATMQTNVPGVYIAGTAAGGTQQKFALFIENCHVHVERIVASLRGSPPPPNPVAFERPES
jgi:thioredoxin reductase (NADPH)